MGRLERGSGGSGRVEKVESGGSSSSEEGQVDESDEEGLVLEDDSNYGAIRQPERPRSPIKPKVMKKKALEVKEAVKDAGTAAPSPKSVSEKSREDSDKGAKLSPPLPLNIEQAQDNAGRPFRASDKQQ